MKRLLIILFFITIIIVGVIFIYGYQILRYSAQNLIRSALPDYIRVEKIDLDLKKGKALFGDFKILNPGDAKGYLLEIEEIACAYRMKGRNILDGIELLEPYLKKPILNIERASDGGLNLDEISEELERVSLESKKGGDSKISKKRTASSKILGNKRLPDIIKLPEAFRIKDGRLVFIDRLPKRKPHSITVENIDADLTVRLDDSYSKILSVASSGTGDLNGNRDEAIRWVTSLNPQTEKLTMSNRFEVSGLDMLPFEPYYDRYSPFLFKRGLFSGTLVFDFDNGNIGSTNEIRLSNLSFSIKEGQENAGFWETTVQDLAKYFTSSSGEIVFDFKIKGELSDPKFHLGPISKQRLTVMAIDKISGAVKEAVKPQDQQPGPQSGKSDIDKAKEYIEFFKDLIKKK